MRNIACVVKEFHINMFAPEFVNNDVTLYLESKYVVACVMDGSMDGNVNHFDSD